LIDRAVAAAAGEGGEQAALAVNGKGWRREPT
jgi:hypothetical protein